MATTTTMAMKATNVDNEALWAGARNFLIPSRNGNYDSKNRQRRTTSVGREASCLSAQHIYIASCDFDDNNGKQTFDDSLGGSSPLAILMLNGLKWQ